MKIPVLCLCLTLMSAFASGTIFKGFYTPEFETYSIEKQSISVVFTLEAPFSIVKQAPLSLSTVLDTSGSLKGRPIELLKGTTEFLTRKLTDGSGFNDLGLVIFDARVNELTPVVPLLPSNSERLLFLIDRIVAGGGTNVAGGLTLGVRQQASSSTRKFKSVYLFSDGLPTVGPTGTGEVLATLQGALQSTDDIISVSTFGFGNKINLELLTEIAEIGGGDTFIITEAEDIPAAFGKALGGLLSIVATNLEVTFSTFPGCQITSISTGGVYTEGSLTVKYWNIYAAEKRDILFKVDLDVGAFGTSKCLQADYVYVDPTTGNELKGGQLVFEVERAQAVKVVRPAIKVEESKLRFIIAKALADAKKKLLVGDRSEAIKIIAEVEVKVEVSVLIDVPEISALLKDVRDLRAEIEARREELLKETAKLNQLEVALEKQRSTSPKLLFESEKQVETEEQRRIKDESVKTVFERPREAISNEDQSNQPSQSPVISLPVDQGQGSSEEDEEQEEQVEQRPPVNQGQGDNEGGEKQGEQEVEQRPQGGNQPRLSVLPQGSNEVQKTGENEQQRGEIREDNDQEKDEVQGEDREERRRQPIQDSIPQRENARFNFQTQNNNNNNDDDGRNQDGNNEQSNDRRPDNNGDARAQNFRQQQNQNGDSNAAVQDEQKTEINDSGTAEISQGVQQEADTNQENNRDQRGADPNQENNRDQQWADSNQNNTQSDFSSPSFSASPSVSLSGSSDQVVEDEDENETETDEIFEQVGEELEGTSG